MYEIGLTGTQRGAGRRQLLIALDLVFTAMRNHGPVRVHVGDCIGFDEQMMTALYGCATICSHPPIREEKRAHAPFDEEMPPKDYLARDRDIVDHGTDRLIAATKDFKMQWRGSGTWYTVRYANDQGRDIHLVMPNGAVRNGHEFITHGPKRGQKRTS